MWQKQETARQNVCRKIGVQCLSLSQVEHHVSSVEWWRQKPDWRGSERVNREVSSGGCEVAASADCTFRKLL